MESVYFESSVFLAIINREKNGDQIRSLLRELKRRRVRIYTSIITVQEISVLSFRHGTIADDPAGKLHKLARIVTLTKDMALTAAKLEAQLKDLAKLPKHEDQIRENRRRKWDCFHIAAAMCLQCATVFSSDDDFLKRKGQLKIDSIDFSKPIPSAAELDLYLSKPEKKSDGKTETQSTPAALPGSAPGSSESEAGATTTKAKAEGEAEAGQG